MIPRQRQACWVLPDGLALPSPLCLSVDVCLSVGRLPALFLLLRLELLLQPTEVTGALTPDAGTGLSKPGNDTFPGQIHPQTPED